MMKSATTFFNFLLLVICMLLFFKAYFPITHNESIIVDPPIVIGKATVSPDEIYSASIDRLILVVIDALRTDFVTEENMPYTFGHKSCLIPTKVEAPTVTLPRIKAITTGAVPQFIDVVLNLGSTVKVADGFLHRAKAAGKKMVFYGDDTWIRMYPDMFLRKEGTTSFFVTDFTEVDNNVTRHLTGEMNNKDWDIMFLHYLGLDHIGHVRGPFSTLIRPKLQEMDGVIKYLHQKTQDTNTLILITGDHGMKDSGGHGGTTYAETHVPLISLGGSKCQTNSAQVEQTDIPTTLSALFGINIAGNSIGKIIPEFFADYGYKELLYVLRYNLEVLQKKRGECDGFREISQMHEEFMLLSGEISEEFLKDVKVWEEFFHNDTLNKKELVTLPKDRLKMELEKLKRYLNRAKLLKNQYNSCLRNISTQLINESVQQDMPLMINTLLISILCLINDDYVILTYVLLPLAIYLEKFATVFILITVFYRLFKNFQFQPIFIPFIVYGVLLQSSSYVEEEHQIWFFFTGTMSLLLFYVKKNELPFSLLVVIGVRILRRLNSTGDQWASYPDWEDWFLNDHLNYLKIFYAVSLIGVFYCIYSKKLYEILPYGLILSLIFIYKMYYVTSTAIAQFIWVLIAVASLYSLNLITTWILIITFLLRPHNVILVPFCMASSLIYLNNFKNVKLLTFLHLTLGKTLFFLQGHANTLASVDLAPAYTGLNSYIPLLVFTLTLIHTYAFPILTLLTLLNKLKNNHRNVLNFYVIVQTWTLIATYILVIIQSGHLFVWSVFAPKLLIECVHTTVLFIASCLINIYKLYY